MTRTFAPATEDMKKDLHDSLTYLTTLRDDADAGRLTVDEIRSKLRVFAGRIEATSANFDQKWHERVLHQVQVQGGLKPFVDTLIKELDQAAMQMEGQEIDEQRDFGFASLDDATSILPAEHGEHEAPSQGIS